MSYTTRFTVSHMRPTKTTLYYTILCYIILHLPSPSQLGNGVSVATEVGAGPVASLTVSVGVGSRYETSENNGSCSVLGAAAFKVRTRQHITAVLNPRIRSTVVIPGFSRPDGLRPCWFCDVARLGISLPSFILVGAHFGWRLLDRIKDFC